MNLKQILWIFIFGLSLPAGALVRLQENYLIVSAGYAPSQFSLEKLKTNSGIAYRVVFSPTATKKYSSPLSAHDYGNFRKRAKSLSRISYSKKSDGSCDHTLFLGSAINKSESLRRYCLNESLEKDWFKLRRELLGRAKKESSRG